VELFEFGSMEHSKVPFFFSSLVGLYSAHQNVFKKNLNNIAFGLTVLC